MVIYTKSHTEMRGIMIKFAVCDDEPFMIDEISTFIAKYMNDNPMISYHISHFQNGQSLLESHNDFDLTFLDIQMEQPDGMITAKRLRQQGNRSLLVFVTVLKECVFDAFEVQAYDYLIKPLDNNHFKRTMDRAMEYLKQKMSKNLVVKRSNSCEVISLSKIIYFEVIGRKIFIHQNNGTVIDYYDRLNELEKQVDKRFFRCHRSYLVNLDYVHSYSLGQIILPQGNIVPVSRLREKDFHKALLYHMRERRT